MKEEETNMNETTKRQILIRAKARAFANTVKASNMALQVPDDVIDWLSDEEFPEFFNQLKLFGLQQNKHYWERSV